MNGEYLPEHLDTAYEGEFDPPFDRVMKELDGAAGNREKQINVWSQNYRDFLVLKRRHDQGWLIDTMHKIAMEYGLKETIPEWSDDFIAMTTKDRPCVGVVSTQFFRGHRVGLSIRLRDEKWDYDVHATNFDEKEVYQSSGSGFVSLSDAHRDAMREVIAGLPTVALQ